MLSVAADHSCATIRGDFGMFLYTNLFQFVYNFRMSCLNGLLQITPQCVNVIKERLGHSEIYIKNKYISCTRVTLVLIYFRVVNVA